MAKVKDSISILKKKLIKCNRMKTKPPISFSGGVGCSDIFPFFFDFGFVMVRYISESGRRRMEVKDDEIRKGGDEITQSNSRRGLWILGVLWRN